MLIFDVDFQDFFFCFSFFFLIICILLIFLVGKLFFFIFAFYFLICQLLFFYFTSLIFIKILFFSVFPILIAYIFRFFPFFILFSSKTYIFYYDNAGPPYTVIQSIHQNENVGRVTVEITSSSLFPLMYITVLFDSLHFTTF